MKNSKSIILSVACKKQDNNILKRKKLSCKLIALKLKLFLFFKFGFKNSINVLSNWMIGLKFNYCLSLARLVFSGQTLLSSQH